MRRLWAALCVAVLVAGACSGPNASPSTSGGAPPSPSTGRAARADHPGRHADAGLHDQGRLGRMRDLEGAGVIAGTTKGLDTTCAATGVQLPLFHTTP